FSQTSRMQIAVSAVSVGEILIRPSAAGEESVELFLSRLDKLIYRIIPFEKDHARLAALIRSKQKATFVDSMIIATAILENRMLISFDRKMMGIYERIK
ncbi:MAG: type II toxin-antitoxin system VapC family toxin, partial [Actinomycetota bacterium]